MLLTLGLITAITAIAIAATARPTISARLDTTPVAATQATDLLTRSTVQLLAFGCDMSNRQGSAVIIGAGRLLTNAHVVTGSRVVDISGDGFPTVVADVPSVARAGDVAVVSASAITSGGIALAADDPHVGDSVRVAGFPSVPQGVRPPGLEITTAQVVGMLAGTDVGEPWPVLRLSVPVQPGMSGGPVLDQEGHLAGIVVGNEVPTGQALAIPVSALRQIVDSGDVVAAGCA